MKVTHIHWQLDSAASWLVLPLALFIPLWLALASLLLAASYVHCRYNAQSTETIERRRWDCATGAESYLCRCIILVVNVMFFRLFLYPVSFYTAMFNILQMYYVFI